MNAGKEIMCSGCDRVIDGECVVKRIDGKEEHYHPDCARARKIKLPVQIMFIERN